jgi:hypothetical protein
MKWPRVLVQQVERLTCLGTRRDMPGAQTIVVTCGPYIRTFLVSGLEHHKPSLLFIETFFSDSQISIA